MSPLGNEPELRLMWAAAVILSALVGMALSLWSVALGFTFFVLPIAVCELLLFGALHLLRLGLSPGDEHESARMTSRYPRSQRSRRAHGRASNAPRWGVPRQRAGV